MAFVTKSGKVYHPLEADSTSNKWPTETIGKQIFGRLNQINDSIHNEYT